MCSAKVLSETGGDMSVFPSSKHLVSWAGCYPRNNKSNRKATSTRISRKCFNSKLIRCCVYI
ncbi:transposase [[Clostridium] scindens]